MGCSRYSHCCLVSFVSHIIAGRLWDGRDANYFYGFCECSSRKRLLGALTNKLDIKHEDYNSVFWFNIVVGIGLYVILFFSAPLIAVFLISRICCGYPVSYF